MNNFSRLIQLAQEVNKEILEDVIPYWSSFAPDEFNGGFVGQVNDAGVPNPNADKGIILNTRILWTYSAAYRVYGEQDYLDHARRSMQYLIDHFWDTENRGFYWSVTMDGSPSDTTKYLYAQAFALYAFSEYCRAEPGTQALDYAAQLFDLIERHCYCPEQNGYHEVFCKEWGQLNGIPLGNDKVVSKHSMNTHLHLMEAYANYLRIKPSDQSAERLQNLVTLHIEKMYDPRIGHFYSFFDKEWNCISRRYSYGHDIEAAWLLMDSARLLNNAELNRKVNKIALEIAESTWREGVDTRYGGLFNFGKDGRVTDDNKQWWAQAEAILGFIHAWLLNGNENYLKAAEDIWKFITLKVKDKQYGEWFFLVDAAGNPYREFDKIGPWKCPYHSSRCAMELRNIFETVTP